MFLRHISAFGLSPGESIPVFARAVLCIQEALRASRVWYAASARTVLFSMVIVAVPAACLRIWLTAFPRLCSSLLALCSVFEFKRTRAPVGYSASDWPLHVVFGSIPHWAHHPSRISLQENTCTGAVPYLRFTPHSTFTGIPCCLCRISPHLVRGLLELALILVRACLGIQDDGIERTWFAARVCYVLFLMVIPAASLRIWFMARWS